MLVGRSARSPLPPDEGGGNLIEEKGKGEGRREKLAWNVGHGKRRRRRGEARNL